MLKEKLYNHGNISILIDKVSIFSLRDKEIIFEEQEKARYFINIYIINEHVQRIVGVRNRKSCKLLNELWDQLHMSTYIFSCQIYPILNKYEFFQSNTIS